MCRPVKLTIDICVCQDLMQIMYVSVCVIDICACQDLLQIMYPRTRVDVRGLQMSMRRAHALWEVHTPSHPHPLCTEALKCDRVSIRECERCVRLGDEICRG